MLRLRRLHTWLGVFFAPLLLFFIATGAYQTFNRDRLKSPGEAETFAQKARVIHTDQIYPAEGEFLQRSSPTAFKALLLAMSAAIAVTIALGVFLAFRTVRPRWPVALALAAGVLVPVLLLLLGHRS